MAKGGRREGAGSKPKWGDRAVKKMLFPTELEVQLNDYVRSLDSGTQIKQPEVEPTFTQRQIEEACNAIALQTKPSDRAVVLRAFRSLKQRLNS